MKKIILTALAALMLSTVAQAQNTTNQPTPPHRIGLIDMAEVFQKYDKFMYLREQMQAEITKSEAELKIKGERFQKLQSELQKQQVGGAAYESYEKQILDQKGDIESFRAATTRRLARRESEMFKVIYTDVSKAVAQYAAFYKFDHVMRFNSKNVVEGMNPQEAVATMNKTFIYSKPENDITGPLLKYLNKTYRDSGGQQPKGTAAGGVPVRAVSQPGTPTRN